MSCPFAHDDAAYVLGALSPGERLEFERHLAGCDELHPRRPGARRPPRSARPGRCDASSNTRRPTSRCRTRCCPRCPGRWSVGRRRRTLAAAGLAAAVVAVVAVGAPVVVNQLDQGDGTTLQRRRRRAPNRATS